MLSHMNSLCRFHSNLCSIFLKLCQTEKICCKEDGQKNEMILRRTILIRGVINRLSKVRKRKANWNLAYIWYGKSKDR
jgi:hypothetical protein